MEVLTYFPERLIEVMGEKNWTQTQLAKALGTTQQTVSRWMKGINEPDLSTLVEICIIFNEEPSYMLGYDLIDLEQAEDIMNVNENQRIHANEILTEIERQEE